MNRSGSRLGAALIGSMLLGLLAVPAAALAQTNGPIAQTGGMTTVLPLFGSSGLTVVLTLVPNSGNVASVALTPATSIVAPVVPASTDPNIAKFANAAGTTKVTVKAMGDKMSVSAKSASLADFIGAGTWSANVFGTGIVTVGYSIGNDGSGKPTLVIGVPSVVAGVTSVVTAPTTHSDSDGEATASGGITFSAGGFVKRLSITIEVDKVGGPAHLRITLSGKDRQKVSDTLAALVAAGNRTWSGYLCDGTTQVTVTYKVNADGTVSFVSATPAVPAAVVTTSDKGFRVRFAGTNVGVSASLRLNDDGTTTTYTLNVQGSSGKCGSGDSKGHESKGDDSKGDSSKGDSHKDGSTDAAKGTNSKHD